MKTLIVLTAIFASSLFKDVQGSNQTELKSKIEESLNGMMETLPMKQGNRDLVRVSLKVNQFGHLEVIDIDYSDEAIKNAVIAKLSEINLESETDPNDVFYYQFSFEKI